MDHFSQNRPGRTEVSSNLSVMCCLIATHFHLRRRRKPDTNMDEKHTHTPPSSSIEFQTQNEYIAIIESLWLVSQHLLQLFSRGWHWLKSNCEEETVALWQARSMFEAQREHIIGQHWPIWKHATDCKKNKQKITKECTVEREREPWKNMKKHEKTTCEKRSSGHATNLLHLQEPEAKEGNRLASCAKKLMSGEFLKATKQSWSCVNF